MAWDHCHQPELKQASKQWKLKESPTPTKFKVLLCGRKVTASVFLDRKGVLLVEFQEQGGTVNAALYCSLLERLNMKQTKRTNYARSDSFA